MKGMQLDICSNSCKIQKLWTIEIKPIWLDFNHGHPMFKVHNPNRILIVALATFFAGDVSAHPGGLNKEGCHSNRKTGEYHCHVSSSQQPTNTSNSSQLNLAAYSSAFGTVDPEPQSNVMQLDYDGFTVWLDCSKRAPVKFRFNAQHDTGNLPRYDTFMFDPDVPSECQQKTSKAYGMGYDRGHQVNANVLVNLDWDQTIELHDEHPASNFANEPRRLAAHGRNCRMLPRHRRIVDHQWRHLGQQSG